MGKTYLKIFTKKTVCNTCLKTILSCFISLKNIYSCKNYWFKSVFNKNICNVKFIEILITNYYVLLISNF